MSTLTQPHVLARAFRVVAVAEAVSWALLLAGMFVKWVLRTSEVGVQLAGPVHGAVFVAYVVVTLLAWRVLRWPLGTAVLALAASVPPFTTVCCSGGCSGCLCRPRLTTDETGVPGATASSSSGGSTAARLRRPAAPPNRAPVRPTTGPSTCRRPREL